MDISSAGTTTAVKPKPEAKSEDVEALDKKSTDEVMEIFEKWIKSEAANTTFMVKGHPRGERAMEHLAGKILEMLRAFVCDGEMPEIFHASKEQLENSFSSFWTNRVKRNVQRQRQQ